MRESRPSLVALAGPAAARIGRFLLVRPLGSSGKVFEAYDETLARGVVVKLLPAPRAGQSDPTGGRTSAVLRNAQALARLSHPNLARVFEAGMHHEQIYVVTERIAGAPLHEWLASSPRPAEISAALLGAGRALETVHESGLAHGELREDSILVGGDGRAHLVGLGENVAQRDGDEDLPASDRRRFAELVGGVPGLDPALRPLLERVDKRGFEALLDGLAKLTPKATDMADVARLHQGMSLALALAGIGVGASAWVQRAEDFTPERMLLQPVLGVVAIGGATLLFRGVLRSAASRSVLALVAFGWAAIFAHRVLSLRAGSDLGVTLVAEALGLALLAVAGGLRHRPWMAWCGVPPLVYALVFTFHPGRAAQSFPVMLGLFLCFAAWRWRGER